MNHSYHNTYLSLGSNIGNRAKNLNDAIVHIQKLGSVIRISSAYDTEPVGAIAQDDFINIALLLETSLAPHVLMDRILAIEQLMGRKRLEPQGPRVIDIDIIFYDDRILDDGVITIPHPRFAERNFVLKPMEEIAPHMMCPIRGMTLRELAVLSTDTHRARANTSITFHTEPALA